MRARLLGLTAALALVAGPALACRVGGASVWFDSLPADAPAGFMVAQGTLHKSERPYPDRTRDDDVVITIDNFIEEIGQIEIGEDRLPAYSAVTSCHHNLWRAAGQTFTGYFVVRHTSVDGKEAVLLNGRWSTNGRWDIE